MPSILVVCEAHEDFEVASTLAERVVRERGPGWLAELLEDPRQRSATRAWRGPDASESFARWRELRVRSKALGVRAPLGKFTGEPGAESAAEARTALALARALRKRGEIEAVMLIRDDDDRARERGFAQAVAEAFAIDPSLVVVVGIADLELEAWLLAGFDPNTHPERERLDLLRAELGVDPTESAHALRAIHDGDVRSPKRALDVLTGSDAERRRQCHEGAPLDRLARRGVGSGLTAFLTSAEQLVKVF